MVYEKQEPQQVPCTWTTFLLKALSVHSGTELWGNGPASTVPPTHIPYILPSLKLSGPEDDKVNIGNTKF